MTWEVALHVRKLGSTLREGSIWLYCQRWGGGILGRGSITCEVPKAGMGLMCSLNRNAGQLEQGGHSIRETDSRCRWGGGGHVDLGGPRKPTH